MIINQTVGLNKSYFKSLQFTAYTLKQVSYRTQCNSKDVRINRFLYKLFVAVTFNHLI